MLALPRGGTTAPTTPLLRFMIAYAQLKVNMRAKLLPYANRKADTETAAQAVRCARTAQAVRPVRAGSFAVNHSGELPLRAAGAQEGRQPAVFHPLVNLPFSLLPWVQTVDCVSVEKKRTAEDFYYRVVSTYSHFGYVTATHTGYFPQTRHNSAAQIFYPCRVFTSCGCSRLAQENVLCGTGMPRLRGVNRLCSRTVAEMRICGYHAKEKILCRSPIS